MKETLLPHEIFGKIQEMEDRKERIAFLKNNAYKQIKTILQLAFNDKIQLDLPPGAPPYTPNPEEKFPISSMSSIFRTIGYCVKSSKYPPIRKESWFISILEQLHAEDARILIAAKDGNIPTFQNKKYSKITKSLVKDTFPELLG